ncbi:TOM1-like protein 2 isoform X2 [Actinia tenebrosa]|uniref:TOM1-like protein 2 isoform X2 n=1 Tax=Actinia tenebrosa TaxID=6105 RepID=A0A6P8J2R4_ACTTE|nr:TOM1-like protein 2 isoform X2 [Actinia tenebrosa]
MASLFASNPFSSPVGQRIERATDGALASEDWALNLEICDIINETEEGPKDAIKAIRKRLTNNKNFKSVILTLTVLESCVKNCGHRFHVLVAKKDFLEEMTKILNPKVNAPQVVQEKILSLLQDWADAFRNSPDMGNILHTYESLRNQGIEFPPKDLDTLSPIFTPERSQPERPVAPLGGSPSHQPSAAPPPNMQPPTHQLPTHQPPPAAVTGPINPTPEQLAKLRSDLDIVQGNVQVMSEMLTEMTPGQEEAGDLELLQELNRTCRAMQQRLMVLLEQVANEEVVGELLRTNDDINNVFIRYDRYERFRQAQSKPAEPPRPAPTTVPPMPPRPAAQTVSPADINLTEASSDALISFDEPSLSTLAEADGDAGATNGVTSQLQGLDIKKTNQEPDVAASVTHDDEFDMFAQSRKSTFEESRQSGTTYSDNQQPMDRLITDSLSINKSQANSSSAEVKPTEPSPMESIESWLGEENVAKEEEASGQAETLSSQDFDQFLAERAASGGQRSNSAKSGSQRPKQRQMQMENKTEDEFFGL